jgi:hypothetical protein
MHKRTFLGTSVNRWLSVALLAGCATAQAPVNDGLPEAAHRSYAVNYRDMMLAACVAEIFKDAPQADDARRSAAAFKQWTSYDMESATGVNGLIIDRYLARTYHAKEAPDVRLDLMKCLDMYHSAELEQQVKQYVDRPDATYAGDEENGE